MSYFRKVIGIIGWLRRKKRSSSPLTLQQTSPPTSPLPLSGLPLVNHLPLPLQSTLSLGQLQRLERELNSGRLPIVRYLPAPKDVTGFNEAPTSKWLKKWLASEIPSVCLEPHNASCHICLIDFEEPPLKPRERQSVSDKSSATEPLRQLACRHVFHQLCIDSYLQSDDSGRFLCPVCHQKVITLSTDLEQWEAEFIQLISTQYEEPRNGFDTDTEESYLGDDNENAFNYGTLKFNGDGLPALSEYAFEPNNKYLNSSLSTRPLLDDAKRLLELNGNLSEAALLLEAAIQKGDLGQGGYEAWVLLGDARHLDARGPQGMCAFARGIRQAQIVDDFGAVGSAVLSLVTLYANESYRKAIHVLLFRWLRERVPNSSITQETLKSALTNSSRETRSRVVNAFLDIARRQHNEGIMDVDVRIGLGELFRANREYSHARSCFGSALAAKPEDYRSWNKLGCSFPGGEDALPAFKEAARLRSTYTQAIRNLGVIYTNLGSNKEGAEHYLSAIALQESAGTPATEKMWSGLRNALFAMDQSELAYISTLEAQTSLEVYRNEGFNF